MQCTTAGGMAKWLASCIAWTKLSYGGPG